MTDPSIENLRRASTAVYLACEESVAADISNLLRWGASEIERLEFELKAARNEIEIADGEIERRSAVTPQDSGIEGKAKAALAYLIEHVEYSDSYGVEGSGFMACHLCNGGGAPGIPLEHAKTCPVARCEAVGAEWWAEQQEAIADRAAVIEECAKVCDQAQIDAGHHHGIEAGIGANIAARRIRALAVPRAELGTGGGK